MQQIGMLYGTHNFFFDSLFFFEIKNMVLESFSFSLCRFIFNEGGNA